MSPLKLKLKYKVNSNMTGNKSSKARGLRACSIRPIFRKLGFKIKWNIQFTKTRFENSVQPLEVVFFYGNLENPEILGEFTRHSF